MAISNPFTSARNTTRIPALMLIALCLASPPLPSAAAMDRHSKQQEKANAAHTAEIADAQKAAEAWLKLLDAEKYAACWAASSTLFRSNVPEPAWEHRMLVVRKPLDPLIARTLNTAEYKTELSGLPRGVYVALVWETLFSDTHSKLESVVMVREQGAWAMAGYAVQ